MAPPGTIMTHNITIVVFVPFFNGARLCTGATAMTISAGGHKAKPRVDPVSTRVSSVASCWNGITKEVIDE
jgi:hypothetical protein